MSSHNRYHDWNTHLPSCFGYHLAQSINCRRRPSVNADFKDVSTRLKPSKLNPPVLIVGEANLQSMSIQPKIYGYVEQGEGGVVAWTVSESPSDEFHKMREVFLD